MMTHQPNSKFWAAFSNLHFTSDSRPTYHQSGAAIVQLNEKSVPAYVPDKLKARSAGELAYRPVLKLQTRRMCLQASIKDKPRSLYHSSQSSSRNFQAFKSFIRPEQGLTYAGDTPDSIGSISFQI